MAVQPSKAGEPTKQAAAFVSAQNFRQFLQLVGPFLAELHRNLEKEEKEKTGENLKKSNGEGGPKLQISIPCHGRTCPD